MTQTSWLRDLRSSEGFVVLTVSIAIFTDTFIYGMIIPIIPVALVDRVGARPEDAQSLVSILLAIYGGSLLIGSPLFGYLADQHRSRKLPFILGLTALGTSTALFAFARTFYIMVIARCLQGLSAAAVWVVGLAIIVDNAPSERVGAAIGETTIGLTWGLIMGPMVGGYIYDKFGYYGSFSIPAVLITLDVALRFVMLEKPSMFPRRIMPNLAVFLTMIDSSKQNKPERSLHPRHISSRSNIDDTSNEQQTGVAHQSLMCQNSDAEQAPLLQSSSGPDEVTKTKQQKATILHLLLTPRLPVALLATLSMAMIFSSLETVLPLFTIETFGWSSSGAGLIFIALSVPSFAGVQIGKVVDRLGVRTLGTFSFVIGACGWGLMRLVTDNTIPHVVLLISLLFILGLSITTSEICAMIEVSQVVDDYEAENPGAFGDKSPIAQSYALFNMAFAGGQLLGPLIAGSIRVNAGWGIMTLVLAIASGATALLFAFLGGPQRKATEAEPETMAS